MKRSAANNGEAVIRDAPGRFANSRFLGIDALRGIAAMSVVLYHYTYEYQAVIGHTQPLGWSFSLGQYGVDLFFMISGFVIFMTLQRIEGISDFVVARFGRLYPAFLTALALTTIVLLSSSLTIFKPSLWQVAVNLTMAPQLFGVDCVDGSYWTLAVELIFYFYAALFFLVSPSKQPEKWCVAWIALSMGAWIAFAAADPSSRSAARLGVLKEVLLAGYANQFTIGVMLYRIASGKANPVSYGLLILCVFLATRIQIQNLMSPAMPGFLNGLVVLSLAALLWIGISNRLPALAMPVLLFLGEISYSLYLLHQRLGYVIIHRIETWGLSPIAAIVFTIPMIVLLAWGMRRYVEVPAQRKIHALYATYRSGRRAVERA